MNLFYACSNHLKIHRFTTAGSDKAEVRHQNVETHNLQFKDQNMQTEILQIKAQQVQAESTTQQQGIKTATIVVLVAPSVHNTFMQQRPSVCTFYCEAVSRAVECDFHSTVDHTAT